MLNNLLENIQIIDFSGRLPGPLSSYVLASLGANIIKLENKDIGGDPFNNQAYTEQAPYFQEWYVNLNKNKNIVSLSFKEELKKIELLIEKSDLLIVNESKYLLNLINENNSTNTPILILSAGKDQYRFLHDLNAMALSKSFIHHLEDDQSPPFLPFAGISFGQQLATTALAIILNSKKTNKLVSETVYLKDTIEEIYNLLHSEHTLDNGRFLHNGAFPCYNVYKLADGAYACLAAVEEKFWIEFNNTFKTELKLEDRFDLTGNIRQKLIRMFSELNYQQVTELIENKDLCLTLTQNKI